MNRDKIVRRVLRERFVATLKGGESFEGLLLDADEKTLRVTDAHKLDGRNSVQVDGEIYLPRSEILYLQKPGGAA
jgi:hypothetical protein